MRRYYLLFLLVLIAPALAEVNECVNSSVSSCPSLPLRNLTFATGVQGSTLLYCSADSDCVAAAYYKCFVDSDGVSSSPYSGWCNSTSITSCYANESATSGVSRAYNTSFYLCTSGTSYRQCSSGAWGSVTSCSGNATCTSGTSSPCSSSATTTTTSSSSNPGSNTTTTVPADARKSTIVVSVPISDFNLTQNQSVTKPLTVKNDGNFSLDNVNLAITGIDASWYSISPSKFDNVTKAAERTFTIAFSAPANASVKSYSVSVSVTTSNSSATASSSFTMKILPSNATVESTIIPLYATLLTIIGDLERNISALESKGINTTDMRNALKTIKEKLNQTSSSIEKKDYFAASQLLDGAKSLIAELQTSISNAKEPSSNIFFILIIVIITAAAGVFLYLMWPSKEGFHPERGWREPKKEGPDVKKLLEKLRKKREEQKYEFKP